MLHNEYLQPQSESESVFNLRELHFIHLNVSSLLPEINELRNIAKLSNAAVIGISKSKLDDSIPSSEILIDNYNTFYCDRNINGWEEICYIRSDFSWIFFPPEIENSCQSEFSEIINTHFSKLDTKNNMKSTSLVILTLTSILISHTFFRKIICFKANRFLVTSKNTMISVQYLIINN